MRVLDLFCGGGLSSQGVHDAGGITVAGVDIDAYARSVFAANNPGARLYDCRVEDLDPSLIEAECGAIDAIVASPVCTHHSIALGNKPKDTVTLETALGVLKFAGVLRPKMIIIENVEKMRSWSRYPELLGGLARHGYSVTQHVLDASDYGVPQSRERLFLVCILNGTAPASIPALRHDRPTVRSILDPKGRWPTKLLADKAASTRKRAGRGIEALGPNEAFITVYYGSDGAGWQSLDRPLRTVTTLGRFALVEPGPQGHTIRMLQVEELKRAMGLPSSFKLGSGTVRSQTKVIGNGVCAPVMEAVFREAAISAGLIARPDSAIAA
ncbi:C-5 cytosine-specific DNA methylase family protein (plasmid) [Bosea sp. RAC05]|nr:C-5 cytosine-specific DNA methylase family protein [Bosea sp. RAC05]